MTTTPTIPPRRSRRSARDAGGRFERVVADRLAWALHDDRIDRRVKRGAKDRGDIAGLRTPLGERIVVEAKDTTRLDLAGWVAEAEVERGNDDAAVGLVIAKRRGKGDPLDAYVVMTVRDLVVLLGGERVA